MTADAPQSHPDEILRVALEHLPDVISVSRAVRDEDGTVVDLRLEYLNASARAAQPAAEEAIGRLASEFWPSHADSVIFAEALRVVATGEPASGTFEWVDQATFQPGGYEYHSIPLDGDQLMFVLRDSTEAMRTAASLAESEARQRALLAGLDEGVLLQASDGSLLSANPAALRILGLRADEAADVPLNDPRWDPVDTEGRSLRATEVANGIALRTGAPHRRQIVRITAADGQQRWLQVSAYPLTHEGEDRPYAVATSFSDITEQREVERALEHQALHDSLTGVPNRILLLDRIRQALALQDRRDESQAVGVLFVDLDGFKLVNDSLGHAAGDHVLRTMAKRMQSVLRAADTVARLGGDEFVIVADALDSPGAESLHERVNTALAEAVVFDDAAGDRHAITMSASIGLVLGRSGDEPTDLIDAADAAMYQVKRQRTRTITVDDESITNNR